MSQTSYSINTVNAFAGALADLQNSTVRTYRALEPIPFGLGLAQGQALANDCRLPMRNKVTLTLSVDLVASNSTVGDVKVTTIVAGVRTAATSNITATVYASSHAATMAAIATKIAAVSGIASATVSGDTIVVLASPDTEIQLLNWVTTLGSGQPTITYVDTTTDTLLGVSLFEQSIENDLTTGVAQYPLYKAVNVLRRGAAYVKAEAAADPSKSVYWRFLDGGAGKPIGGFSGSSDSGLSLAVTRENWPDSIAALAVGVLEISLP